jgi:hypothetical protein
MFRNWINSQPSEKEVVRNIMKSVACNHVVSAFLCSLWFMELAAWNAPSRLLLFFAVVWRRCQESQHRWRRLVGWVVNNELEGIWEEAKVLKFHTLFCYLCVGRLRNTPKGLIYIAGFRVEGRAPSFPNTEQVYLPLCWHIRCVFVKYKVIRAHHCVAIAVPLVNRYPLSHFDGDW